MARWLGRGERVPQEASCSPGLGPGPPAPHQCAASPPRRGPPSFENQRPCFQTMFITTREPPACNNNASLAVWSPRPGGGGAGRSRGLVGAEVPLPCVAGRSASFPRRPEGGAHRGCRSSSPPTPWGPWGRPRPLAACTCAPSRARPAREPAGGIRKPSPRPPHGALRGGGPPCGVPAASPLSVDQAGVWVQKSPGPWWPRSHGFWPLTVPSCVQIQDERIQPVDSVQGGSRSSFLRGKQSTV